MANEHYRNAPEDFGEEALAPEELNEFGGEDGAEEQSVLRAEPIRIVYSVAVAALIVLAAFGVTDGPLVEQLAKIVALIGGGEFARSQVTPVARLR